MDIPYYPEITIPSFRFTSTVARFGNVTWSRTTGKVNSLARDAYGRDLYLKQRIQYVHTLLLPKIWHTAQIFPDSKEHERQLLTAISWCMWRGVIFRVSLATLELQTEDGGVDLIDDAAKFHALFPTRFWAQGKDVARWRLSGSTYEPCSLPGRPAPTYAWSLGSWNTYAFIFTNGSIWNPRGRPLKEVCMTPCELRLLWRCASGSCSHPLTGHWCGTISTTWYCLMEPGQHGIRWFTTLYLRMSGCIEFDWWTRKTVRNAGGRTQYYIDSQNVGWDRRFGNGPPYG